MKVLVTGCNGLVGQKLVTLFAKTNAFDVIVTSRREQSVFDETELAHRQLDITNKRMVRTTLDELEPEIIVNSAAIADVDACEEDRASAWQTNVAGVENLVYASKLIGAKLIQISTDYVFDGKNGPYDEHERPNPINYYGKTKLAAENIVRASGIPYAIVRAMFLYGAGFETKPNFAMNVVQKLQAGEQVKAPDDQFSNPTLADDIAYAVLKIIELERSGIYNIGGPSWINRYEFAMRIASAFGFEKKRVVPVKLSSLKQVAQRPFKSGFITLKAEIDLGFKTTSIEQGLMMFMSQMREFKKYPQEDASA